MIVSAFKTLTWGTLAFAVLSAVMLAFIDESAQRIDPYTDQPAARPAGLSRAERNTDALRAVGGSSGSSGATAVRDTKGH